MILNLMEDIHPVSELKKNTRKILEQAHKTGRPVVLTVNGKASAVILDVQVYEKHRQAMNIAKILLEAENDIIENNTRPAISFLEEFKRARQI